MIAFDVTIAAPGRYPRTVTVEAATNPGARAIVERELAPEERVTAVRLASMRTVGRPGEEPHHR